MRSYASKVLVLVAVVHASSVKLLRCCAKTRLERKGRQGLFSHRKHGPVVDCYRLPCRSDLIS